jgi:EpsI family protein
VSTGTAPVRAGEATHRVNRYTLDNGRRRVLVYYWYQGRGRVVANEYRMKWNLLRDAALMGRTDEALVRVIVPVDRSLLGSASGASAEQAADSLALAVASELLPAVERVLPPPPSSRAPLRTASTR